MNKKRIIIERDIIETWKSGAKTIDFDSNTIITPQARDSAKIKNISFISISSEKKSITDYTTDAFKSFAIGSDHGGFRLKEIIKRFLAEKKYNIQDVGTHNEDPCDYPDIAFQVAQLVKNGKVEIGIIVDGTGIASCIVANKVNGIRAACCTNEFMAQSAREHNNSNILTLGGRVIGEELAKNIVSTFIRTPFLEGRHIKRLEKIREIEINTKIQ